VYALLLIDFQKDFFAADGRMSLTSEQAEYLIVVANRLIDLFHNNRGVVIFIGSEFNKTDFVGNLFRRFSALKGSDGAHLDPRINSKGCPYFPKSKSDAFSNPDLDAYLKKHRVTSIYMCGVYSEGCIRATAVGARKKGYQVSLIVDAVLSNRRFKHNWALSYLSKRGVTLVSSENLLRTPLSLMTEIFSR
jgi:nicotinamidase-related amidase